ncbi:MAG: nuclear transport factor 2 family protein [Actinomycetes bacterium]
MDVTDLELRDAVDHIAISRLIDGYADVVTRRAWEELHELFLPTCTVHIDTVTGAPRTLTGPAEAGTFIAGAVERFSFFEFVVLNRRIELRVGGDPDGASGRIFMREQRQGAVDGRYTSAFGCYRDRFARVDGRWWFAERRYRSLARTAADGAEADLEVMPWPDDL